MMNFIPSYRDKDEWNNRKVCELDIDCGHGKCQLGGTTCSCDIGYMHHTINAHVPNCFLPVVVYQVFHYVNISLCTISVIVILFEILRYYKAHSKETSLKLAPSSVGISMKSHGNLSHLQNMPQKVRMMIYLFLFGLVPLFSCLFSVAHLLEGHISGPWTGVINVLLFISLSISVQTYTYESSRVFKAALKQKDVARSKLIQVVLTVVHVIILAILMIFAQVALSRNNISWYTHFYFAITILVLVNCSLVLLFYFFQMKSLSNMLNESRPNGPSHARSISNMSLKYVELEEKVRFVRLVGGFNASMFFLVGVAYITWYAVFQGLASYDFVVRIILYLLFPLSTFPIISILRLPRPLDLDRTGKLSSSPAPTAVIGLAPGEYVLALPDMHQNVVLDSAVGAMSMGGNDFTQTDNGTMLDNYNAQSYSEDNNEY